MSRRCHGLTLAVVALWVVASSWTEAKAPALESPPSAALTEARAIVDAMKASPRGPYSRIRWYCKDGAVLPPKPYACSEHGGGRQHGEYSEQRRRLAELGWPVGTVLAATDWNEWWEAKPRQGRLRELPLERYLVEVDDGWILRGARTYRGHVQVEDEERAGRELLLRLLESTDWVRDNYLLLRELIRTLPHGSGEDRVRSVRRLSQEIAESAPSFEPVRAEIHTRPGAGSAARTRAWTERARAGRAIDPEVIDRADALALDLDALYGANRRTERLDAARAVVVRGPGGARIDGLLAGLAERPADERIARLGATLRAVRETLAEPGKPEARLRLLDLATEVENELVASAADHVSREGLTRRELIEAAQSLLDGAYGAGLFSGREREALAAPLAALGDTTAETDRYIEATRMLRRCGDWAASTVRFHFAEALTAFGALEPEAGRFTDDLLRSSPLLALAEVSRLLSLDADHGSGRTHRFFGASYAQTLGLNPGVRRGKLRVVRPGDLRRGLRVQPDEIVVLPETVSELDPVAGILGLSAGNLLSHVQLLARNLGIPNATLPASLLPQLEARDGRTVLLAVDSNGSVFLDLVENVPPEILESLSTARAAAAAVRFEPPMPDLGQREPIPLEYLHAGLSGTIVGPKAANLGELARNFPGRVSPAIALPFGIFAEHVAAGPDSPRALVDRAFAGFRAGELDRAALEASVEQARLAIRSLALLPAYRSKLTTMMHDLFGAEGYGVFVRSDTNVEDLPGFTGAGLNETVPNVVGLEAQLAAIPRVWSSPFTQRAMGWRAEILTRPEEVYTSVLLQKSVAADKSGVLVTTDLGRGEPGLTVAMAWGVGGAVDGEAAEQLAIGADGSVRLVAEAKAPYRRRLKESGGVEWVPAPSGAVLEPADIEALEAFAVELGAKLTPAVGTDGARLPWDVELGFVAGRLTLFQVRPLVERGEALADRIVSRLIPAGRAAVAQVRLDRPPYSSGETPP